jgi:hypothetical protein
MNEKEAEDIFANDHLVVNHDDFPLLEGAEPTSDDPLGHRLQQPRIPSIHLHPLHPP